jgi:hypothetical protein
MVMLAPSLLSVEATLLFRLRLVLARYGEMDVACWWNTRSVLGKLGTANLSRGFPATHNFAQARIAFAVARARCKEVFSAPDCFTLWNLPPETEEILDAHWHGWCQVPDTWTPIFDEIAEANQGDLREQLLTMKLIDEAAQTTVVDLKLAPQSKSVQLPLSGSPDNHAVMCLAAGFSRGTKGHLVVPYIKKRSEP